MTKAPQPAYTHRVYIGLGSNINPEQNIPLALVLLSQQVQIISVSQVWETQPVGSGGANFLNAAVLVTTQLPLQLLKNVVLRPIESRLGRKRTFNKNAPRQIDLDILIYDERVVDTKIWARAFLAVPLAELVPKLLHPDTHETLQEISTHLAEQTILFSRPDIILAK